MSFFTGEEDLSGELFSSCPVLESVQLWNCNLSFLKVLNVSALILKHLEIDNCGELENIEINLLMPSLTSIICRGNLAQNYQIRDSPSLHYADIQVGEVYRDKMSINILSRVALKLLTELQNVNVLAVIICFGRYMLCPLFFPSKRYKYPHDIPWCCGFSSTGPVIHGHMQMPLLFMTKVMSVCLAIQETCLDDYNPPQ